jgi:hypothetical protein
MAPVHVQLPSCVDKAVLISRGWHDALHDFREVGPCQVRRVEDVEVIQGACQPEFRRLDRERKRGWDMMRMDSPEMEGNYNAFAIDKTKISLLFF